MTSINAVQARTDLFKVIDLVNETATPVTLTNSEGKNAVLIGEDDWHAIQETLYLISVPDMAESLINGRDASLAECIDEADVKW